jgi:MFS family permease
MKDNKVAPVPAANEPLKPLDPDGLRQRTAPVSDAEAAGKIQAALRGKKGRENVSEKRANVFEGTMKKMGHQINKFKLTKAQKLITDPHTRKMSMRVVWWACFIDTCCATICAPNYNFMCTPNAHEDSFLNTKPFDLGMAINLIPASGAFGKIIASALIVKLSNKIGRKPCLLLCIYGGGVCCILKFLFRGTYWGFIAMNFLNGLFGASIVIGFIYVDDLFGDDGAKKSSETNGLIGGLILGLSAGNLIAIAMEEVGLFESLLVGAALSFVAGFFVNLHMVEADKSDKKEGSQGAMHKEGEDHSDHTDTNDDAPKVLDKKLLYQIIFGSAMDQLGSAGPAMMFQLVFYSNYYVAFLASGQTPVVSAMEFRWFDTAIFVTLFITIAVVTPLQKLMGPSGVCVLGNALTAVATGVLYYLAGEGGGPKPSSSMKIIFIVTHYLANALTTLSMITTQPMIDAIVPKAEKPDAMALNQMASDTMQAISPLIFSAILDRKGTEFFMWFTVVCSILATAVNVPLMRVHALSGAAFTKLMDASMPKNKKALESDLQPDGDGWISAQELHLMVRVCVVYMSVYSV